jgi:hypothetical protein
VPTERLLENGQQLRDAATQGVITPLVTPAEQNFAPPPDIVPAPLPPGRVVP